MVLASSALPREGELAGKVAGKKNDGARRRLVGDCVFGAVDRLRKWRGGVKVRLTGNRQNAAFRCGRLAAAQAALFPNS
jgi:hypothetical protein